MKYVYPVVFEKDEDKIGVTVPDIKGCFTFGDDMPDAIEMATDAMAMILASMEDKKEKIPEPSNLSDIKTNGIVSLVLVDTDEWRKQFDNKAVKKTLSIPSWLNKRAESAGVNFSQILQDALKNAIA
jgi:antitoxin HicB